MLEGKRGQTKDRVDARENALALGLRQGLTSIFKGAPDDMAPPVFAARVDGMACY
jgi:hypothetical protein